MITEETFSQSVHAALAAGSADSDADPSETVRPSTAADGATAVGTGLSDTGEELGRGGMGVVRAAIQRSLGRPVAVKAPGMEDPPPHIVRGLLHEASVAALLDHPNVLPVHDVIIDARGRPQIVMKRVEGQPWSAIARKPSDILSIYGSADPLAWNLGVFLQVCNAVAFAHDRGILHRDLKLDNVMIGRFGEVFVLDWGVALALDDRYGDRLPRAADERRVAGTPRYMAPEMATGDGPRQGPWTDVYLLGGVLHHVLTGRPPHRGEELREVLVGIPNFQCDLPGVPTALAAVVAKALAYRPEDRYATVAELQREIRTFLGNRGAVRLAREARIRFEALEARLADAPPNEVYAAFGPIRFGYEQALAEWPDFADAAAGLATAKIRLARWELARGEPGAAAALLEGLAAPDGLGAEVAAAIDARRAREAALEALRRDEDPTLGRRTRAFVLALAGGVWVVQPLVLGLLDVTPSWTKLFVSSAWIFVLCAGLAIWARDSLSKTWMNRMSAATMLLVAPVQAAGDVGVQALGLAPEQALALRPFGWAALAAGYAVAVDARLLLVALGYAAAGWVCTAWPAATMYALSASNLGLVVGVYLLWGHAQLRADREERG